MRTRKTVVVLISGKAGAGKTTLQDFIEKLLNAEQFKGIKVATYGFADPLKYMATSFIGWDGNKSDKGRKLLQELGRIGRDYDEDIWAKHLISQMDKLMRKEVFPKNFWIVDDWRFPNELKYLKSNPLLDVFTVRVTDRGYEMSDNLSEDTSETSLSDNGDYDMKIKNNSDLAQLEKSAETLVEKLREKFIVE